MHPGEQLREDILHAGGMGKSEFAGAIRLWHQHFYDDLNKKKPVSQEVAPGSIAAFGDGPSVWFWMQSVYDARQAQHAFRTKSIKAA
jgi:plasmid maintenance system antidote protein VapI